MIKPRSFALVALVVFAASTGIGCPGESSDNPADIGMQIEPSPLCFCCNEGSLPTTVGTITVTDIGLSGADEATVNSDTSSPSHTASPESQTVPVGGSAQFTVEANQCGTGSVLFSMMRDLYDDSVDPPEWQGVVAGDYSVRVKGLVCSGQAYCNPDTCKCETYSY